eukprot:g66936.t1
MENFAEIKKSTEKAEKQVDEVGQGGAKLSFKARVVTLVCPLGTMYPAVRFHGGALVPEKQGKRNQGTSKEVNTCSLLFSSQQANLWCFPLKPRLCPTSILSFKSNAMIELVELWLNCLGLAIPVSCQHRKKRTPSFLFFPCSFISSVCVSNFRFYAFCYGVVALLHPFACAWRCLLFSIELILVLVLLLLAFFIVPIPALSHESSQDLWYDFSSFLGSYHLVLLLAVMIFMLLVLLFFCPLSYFLPAPCESVQGAQVQELGQPIFEKGKL